CLYTHASWILWTLFRVDESGFSSARNCRNHIARVSLLCLPDTSGELCWTFAHYHRHRPVPSGSEGGILWSSYRQRNHIYNHGLSHAIRIAHAVFACITFDNNSRSYYH